MRRVTRRGGMSLPSSECPGEPYCPTSGSRATNASRLPSGDHASSVTGPGQEHTTVRSPAAATGRMQISDGPPPGGAETNASRRPSGDQRGRTSWPGPVNGCGGPSAGSIGASQIRRR